VPTLCRRAVLRSVGRPCLRRRSEKASSTSSWKSCLRSEKPVDCGIAEARPRPLRAGVGDRQPSDLDGRRWQWSGTTEPTRPSAAVPVGVIDCLGWRRVVPEEQLRAKGVGLLSKANTPVAGPSSDGSPSGAFSRPLRALRHVARTAPRAAQRKVAWQGPSFRSPPIKIVCSRSAMTGRFSSSLETPGIQWRRSLKGVRETPGRGRDLDLFRSRTSPAAELD
jgi:hypothetical protein